MIALIAQLKTTESVWGSSSSKGEPSSRGSARRTSLARLGAAEPAPAAPAPAAPAASASSSARHRLARRDTSALLRGASMVCEP